MDLKTYLSKIPKVDRQLLAEKANTSVGHLTNVSYGDKPLSAISCVLIERETKGLVTRQELRAKDWHLIWPELINVAPPAKKSIRANAHVEKHMGKSA